MAGGTKFTLDSVWIALTLSLGVLATLPSESAEPGRMAQIRTNLGFCVDRCAKSVVCEQNCISRTCFEVFSFSPYRGSEADFLEGVRTSCESIVPKVLAHIEGNCFVKAMNATLPNARVRNRFFEKCKAETGRYDAHHCFMDLAKQLIFDLGDGS